MNRYFRKLLQKFCSEGTMLGLKYFYLYPDKLSRCFWGITLSSILSFACWVTWLLYRRFEEMPTRITIENQYEQIKNFPYPAITICSPNQITISAMKHFNSTLVDGNLTLNIESALPQLLGFYELTTFLNKESLEHLQSLIDLNRYTLPEVMGLLPQSCNRFLKLCYFQRQRYIHCEGLFRSILTRHGLCCIFNNVYHYRNKRRNEKYPHFNKHLMTRSGLMEGLTVVSDYEPEDAMNGTILNAGAIRVMFTDWSEFPADDQSSLIQTNAETFNAIHETYTYCSEEVKSLSAWSRNCYFEDEHKLPYFNEYHNSDCDMYCYVHIVEKKCHCTLFYVPYLLVQNACNATSVPCIMDVSHATASSEVGWISNSSPPTAEVSCLGSSNILMVIVIILLCCLENTYFLSFFSFL